MSSDEKYGLLLKGAIMRILVGPGIEDQPTRMSELIKNEEILFLRY